MMEEENCMLREKAAVMAEQMVLKDDFHARQVCAASLAVGVTIQLLVQLPLYFYFY
jgi:hypothetical protein